MTFTHRFYLILFCVGLAACPTDADEATVVDTCAKTGTQCRLAGNKLGVCMMLTDGSFTCTDQH